MSRSAGTADPAAWGVQTEYVDVLGQRHEVSRDTVRAVLEAMEADGEAPQTAGPLVLEPGDPVPSGHLELEEGREIRAPKTCRSLPLGYHTLVHTSGARQELIVSPGRCPAPAGLAWGWAVQLYSLRSAGSWGMGDLADLTALSRWAAAQGAAFVLINPLHAANPRLPQQPSPYYASSRMFRNLLYLRVEDAPGAAGDTELLRLAERGRGLSRRRVIDRDAVFRLKRRGLERLWKRFGGDTRFDEYRALGGETLRRFAAFCVACEERAEPWAEWPFEIRRPDSHGVGDLERNRPVRMGFHAWVQWLLELQLQRASRGLRIMHDLAIGVDPSGADAWLWQDILAPGVRVGAPPDEFAAGGQDWGLPPFDPHKIRVAGYRPFIDTLRSSLRRDGGLRIDHVMGLFRLWWIPPGASPADGAYVRYPARDLLNILALESHRSGCLVVGEDLGTVEPGVRAALRRRNVLSYRLGWFEDAPPTRYPSGALAALGTHDLPTIAGLWTGEDLLEQRRAGLPVNDEAVSRVERRLQRLARARPDSPLEDVVVSAYASLGRAPSRLVAVGLDDAALAVRRPNLPGDMRRPNWSIPLPRTLEQLRRERLPRRIAAAMRQRRG